MELERRFLPGAEVKVAQDDGGPTLEGYAAVFNQRSHVIFDPIAGMDAGVKRFVEVIQPGAFSGVLAGDVRLKLNHDPNLVMARSPRTMTLSQDARGLFYRARLDPKSPLTQQVVSAVERGDIDGNSFLFAVGEQRWDLGGEVPVRTIVSFRRLLDVGPATHPAYPGTEVNVRSQDVHAAVASLMEARSAAEAAKPEEEAAKAEKPEDKPDPADDTSARAEAEAQAARDLWARNARARQRQLELSGGA